MKIVGERFASGLSVNHPMGHYLEALFHTGYYYPFIGVMQVLAAGLLLVPRTATLGALLYFPIIVNICVLSLAVRFEGSLLTSPLMVLANLYLLCWDYHKFRHLCTSSSPAPPPANPVSSRQFPAKFFAAVVVVVVALALLPDLYQVMPRNSLADCRRQFAGTHRTAAGYQFCSCIHQQGKPLTESLNEYDRAPNDKAPDTR